MPRLNGFDVLKWIRSQAKLYATPVLILSGSSEDRDIDRAYSLGASSYFVKPSDPRVLEELFRVLQAYWCSFNVLPHLAN